MRTSVVTIFLLAGCASGSSVVRVYDGKVVEGAYVPSEAYAAYLHGVLEEESGNDDAAEKSYRRALDADDEDAEVWTRLASLLCRRAPKDTAADHAFDKAFAVDRTYAGALAAKSRCAAVRGDTQVAFDSAARASKEDPGNPSVEAVLVKSLAARPDPAGRDRAVALTIAHGERAVAWEALVAWARAKNDPDLVARGLAGLVRAAPATSAAVEKAALDLAGEGQTALARDVAAAIADAPPELGVLGPRDPTVARLAVDEALVRADETAARRRAVRGHVPLAEVAARALAWDRRDIAKHVATFVTSADPGSTGARMVLAALDGSARPEARATDRPPALAALLLAERVASAAGPDVARAFLAGVPREKSAPHDPLVGPLAVDLAARGVLPASELGPDLRVELAARRREVPAQLDPRAQLDAKHALLFHALTAAKGDPARDMLARLAPAAERDPIVGFAVARIAFENVPEGENDAWARIRRAVASSPAHPLLLAIALELAKRGGKGEEITPARARLMAVARTPAERALATE